MVHGIVNRHGGSIDIRSRAGHGTTITLTLPIWQPDPAAADPLVAPTAAPPAGRPITVLVVDDEHPVRAVTVAMLARDGHHVVEATGAQEALRAFEAGAEEFDVVVTDRAMPGLSGDQLAVELKRRRPDLPVVMLTGFGALMNGETSTSVDALLTKPVSLAALRRALADVAPTAASPSAGTAGMQRHAHQPSHVGDLP
jgi:CheY-like chemotaxis protein